MSVAKSLLENVIYPAKDPDYIEGVVKSALGSMYLGEFLHKSSFHNLITEKQSAGSDTVSICYSATEEANFGIIPDSGDNMVVFPYHGTSPGYMSSCARLRRPRMQRTTSRFYRLRLTSVCTRHR